MALKHVGRVVGNRRKVIVAYRVIPGDPDYCLVVQTENLDAGEHDALIKTVESAAGQEAYEFAEAMARAFLPDGRNMLAGFNATGKLNKIETKLPVGSCIVANNYFWLHGRKPFKENKNLSRELLRIRGAFFN